MAAGTPSSCRPPWLDTMMPSTPASAASLASSNDITPAAADYAPVADDHKFPPIVIGGKKLEERQAKAITEEMTAAFSTMNAQAAKIDADFPWKSESSIELDAMSTAQWLAGLKVSELCRKLIQIELEGTNNVALARQSYLGNLTQVKGGGVEKYWTESEAFRCIGGASQLTLRFQQALGLERITHKAPVIAIRAKEREMVVSTADGEPHECDDVVLAVPPTSRVMCSLSL